MIGLRINYNNIKNDKKGIEFELKQKKDAMSILLNCV